MNIPDAFIHALEAECKAIMLRGSNGAVAFCSEYDGEDEVWVGRATPEYDNALGECCGANEGVAHLRWALAV